MTDPNTIAINNKPAFRTAIANMQQLNETLDEKLKGAEQVTAAVTAAAGKDVVYGASTGSGGKVANAYAGTVSAMETAARSITTQAEAARSAVTSAISELTALVDGLEHIDNTGAGNVNKTG